MTDQTPKNRHEQLCRELEGLEDQLAAAALPERDEIAKQIEAVERQIKNLELDQHNRTSMEGGSEA